MNGKVRFSPRSWYVLDDPNEGHITKPAIADYLARMKEDVASIRGEDYAGPFMELIEVTTREDSGILTAWCWWSIPDTTFQGAGLIKVGDDGGAVGKACVLHQAA